jgi:isochorismate hydrolase
MRKESYFAVTNISQKAEAMLRSAQALVPRRHLSFSPRQSALLILDMQNYFLDSASHAFIPSAPAIVSNINRLCQAYARMELPVIFTRHLNSAQDAGLMAEWWQELIREADPLSEIISDFKYGNQTVLKKSRYDAFMDSPLAEMLRQMQVRQLVICGVMANVCCETTARSAFQKGYEVFFLVDGTAAYNERFHMASLLNLGFAFAELALTGDICHRISG